MGLKHNVNKRVCQSHSVITMYQSIQIVTYTLVQDIKVIEFKIFKGRMFIDN